MGSTMPKSPVSNAWGARGAILSLPGGGTKPLGGDLGLLEHGVEVGVVDAVDHAQLAARVLDAAEHHEEQLVRDLPRLAAHADGVEHRILEELGDRNRGREAERGA